MKAGRILIAGVGNIFMGDDAFGCEVARRLGERPMAEGVTVKDFGIRGLDLTYAMLEGYEAVIIVDAAPRGGGPAAMDGHGMDPVKVLSAAAALGAEVGQVLVVGCEPAKRDADADWEMGMSPAVETAVGEAVRLVESLVARIINKCCKEGSIFTGGID